jgi:hypothetical protein
VIVEYTDDDAAPRPARDFSSDLFAERRLANDEDPLVP